MTDCAIQAEYADYKRVKGRKVLQLICEVPIEKAPEIHKLLGEPAFGERQITVGIARLNVAAVEPEKPKGKSYAQQAALVCKEVPFQRFCCERFDSDSNDSWTEDETAEFVRTHCSILSRSELIEGTPAGNEWRNLHADYKIWLNS